MISNIQSSQMAYVQQTAPKDDSSKGVAKTNKSEEVDKVSALKEQIENGTYKINLKDTASAVAEELL